MKKAVRVTHKNTGAQLIMKYDDDILTPALCKHLMKDYEPTSEEVENYFNKDVVNGFLKTISVETFEYIHDVYAGNIGFRVYDFNELKFIENDFIKHIVSLNIIDIKITDWFQLEFFETDFELKEIKS